MATVAVLALPAVASADVTRRDRRGDVKAPGLTAKERNALDMVRVEATSVSFGVMVTATMRGNIEKALGRGRLRNAAVALVLDAVRRRSTDGVIAVAGRRGGQSVAKFARRYPYAVAVDGREVTFVGVGVDLEKVRAIKVATLASTAARGGGAGAAQAGKLLGGVQRALENASADAFALNIGIGLRRELAGSLKDDCRKLEGRRFVLELVKNRLQQESLGTGGRSLTVRVLKKVDSEIEAIRAEMDRRPCPKTTVPPGDGELVAEGEVSHLFFTGGPEAEVRIDTTFDTDDGNGTARAAASANPVDAVRYVLPPAASGPRQVTNFFCPDPLPSGAISTTTNANDTLTCSGGSLPLGQRYSAAIRLSPAPQNGMGMQVSARQDGQFTRPFQLPGPARSCGFSFAPSGATHLVLWECSDPHGAVRFDFNVGVQKPSQSDGCPVDGADPSVVNCSGNYSPFSTQGFTVTFASGTCAEARFTAQTTFAPGDLQTFPEKACG